MLKVKNTEVAFLGRAVKACSNAYSIGEIDTRWCDLDFITDDLFEAINDNQGYKDECRSIVRNITQLGSNQNNQPKQSHDHFLSMVTVSADLKYPRYISPEFQRYHWFEIASSQSTMHTAVKVIQREDYRDFFNDEVSSSSINNLKMMCSEYLFLQECNRHEIDTSVKNLRSEEIEDLFHRIKSNLPEGYELWLTFNTNYLQLKTMLTQRYDHRLRDWKPFVEWIHSLPLFDYLTGMENLI